MKLQSLRRTLLAWYRKNRRPLPWRETSDPYRIWVSEVMLQQTRVAAVIPYYRRFLSRFPDLSSLARADGASVLKAWEGLGYYSRARNLQAAAREVAERYGGTLPSSSARLRELPGFGPYTSAAVGSIAFGEPVAVVDGNVRRVLSRLFEADDGLDRLAQEFLDPKRAGDFNQAVMELGALVCLPRTPLCPSCPLSRHCSARKNGTTGTYPPVRKKPKVTKLFSLTAVLRRGNRLLLRKRPPGGRWGGMWEFPTLEGRKPLLLAAARKEFGASLEMAGRFVHQLSHQEIHATVARGVATGSPRGGRWVTPRELSGLALSRFQQEALRIANG